MAEFVEEVAAMGQGPDTAIAHLTPGEIVIPREVQDNMPQVVQAFIKAMKEAGMNWRQFVVGSQEGNFNEETGLQEFVFVTPGGGGFAQASIGQNFFSGGKFSPPSRSGGGTPSAPRSAPGGSDFEGLTPRQQRAAIATFGLFGDSADPGESVSFFKDTGGEQLLPIEEAFLERASITNPEATSILDLARAPEASTSSTFFNNLLNGSGFDTSRFL